MRAAILQAVDGVADPDQDHRCTVDRNPHWVTLYEIVEWSNRHQRFSFFG